MARRESLDVHLVNQGPMPRRLQASILSPTKCRVYHDTLRQPTSAIPLIFGQISVWMSDGITKQRIAPFNRPGNSLGVRVQQQLGRVKTVAFLRCIGPVDAIAIAL